MKIQIIIHIYENQRLFYVYRKKLYRFKEFVQDLLIYY